MPFRGERCIRYRRDMRCVGRFVKGLHTFGSGVIERDTTRNDAIQALGEVAIKWKSPKDYKLGHRVQKPKDIFVEQLDTCFFF